MHLHLIPVLEVLLAKTTYMKSTTSSSVSGAPGCIVLRFLFNMWQKLAVERNDHTLLAVLSRGGTDVEVKVNGRHDATPTLLVDDAQYTSD